MARGLAHLFSNNNGKISGNSLEVVKGRGYGEERDKLERSLESADIVILAIPAQALKTFVADNFHILRHKILIDCTNSEVRGEDLAGLCGLTDVRWVKAFNDIGAADILLNKPFSKTKICTTICSRDKKSLEIVTFFAEESLGLSCKAIPFEQYENIAQHQNSLGEEWIHASMLILFIFALTETYAVLRYNVFKGYGKKTCISCSLLGNFLFMT